MTDEFERDETGHDKSVERQAPLPACRRSPRRPT